MDQQQFTRRTEVFREQFDTPEAYSEFDQEVRSDERVQAMAAQIKEMRLARRSGVEEEALISANRDLVDAVRTETMAKRGIHLDLDKMEQEAEEDRRNKVKSIHESLTGEETEKDLLHIFALTDENGQFSKESLKTPLFKERTRMAFDAYIASVGAFKALVDYNSLMGVPSQNVGKADAMRGEIHDAVAKEVAEDLDLEFDVARSLVAKIRDGVEPQSSEQDTYARSILRVGRRLEKRYGADVASAVEDNAKPILRHRTEEPR